MSQVDDTAVASDGDIPGFIPPPGTSSPEKRVDDEKEEDEKQEEDTAVDPTDFLTEEDVSSVEAMGFSKFHAQKGLLYSDEGTIESAVEWLVLHENDEDIDDPIEVSRSNIAQEQEPPPPLSSSPTPSESSVNLNNSDIIDDGGIIGSVEEKDNISKDSSKAPKKESADSETSTPIEKPLSNEGGSKDTARPGKDNEKDSTNTTDSAATSTTTKDGSGKEKSKKKKSKDTTEKKTSIIDVLENENKMRRKAPDVASRQVAATSKPEVPSVIIDYEYIGQDNEEIALQKENMITLTIHPSIHHVPRAVKEEIDDQKMPAVSAPLKKAASQRRRTSIDDSDITYEHETLRRSKFNTSQESMTKDDKDDNSNADEIHQLASSFTMGKPIITSRITPASSYNTEVGTFEDCTKLTCLTLHDDVQTIGVRAFANCKSLTKIVNDFPYSLTEVNDMAFYNCTALKDVKFNTTAAKGRLKGEEGKDEEDGIKRLGNSVFTSCFAITNIQFPLSLTGIGNDVFYYCINLKKVQLNEGLTTIGKRAFSGCFLLESITLPSSLGVIDDEVFSDCRRLREVIFNTSATANNDLIGDEGQQQQLEKIGRCAFSNCVSLITIAFPSTLRDIGQDAFRNCTKLSHIQFNDGLFNIGRCAFGGCTALQSVIIPPSVNIIGNWAFRDCTKLKKVELSDELMQNYFWAKKCNAFAGCTSLENMKEVSAPPPTAVTMQSPKAAVNKTDTVVTSSNSEKKSSSMRKEGEDTTATSTAKEDRRSKLQRSKSERSASSRKSSSSGKKHKSRRDHLATSGISQSERSLKSCRSSKSKDSKSSKSRKSSRKSTRRDLLATSGTSQSERSLKSTRSSKSKDSKSRKSSRKSTRKSKSRRKLLDEDESERSGKSGNAIDAMVDVSERINESEISGVW